MPRHLEIRVREVPVARPAPKPLLARMWDAIRSYTIAPLSIQSPEIQRLLGGETTSAGVTMSAEKALMLSAVWDAVQTIAGDIASLPLHLYKRLPNGGKEKMPDHPLYRLLHDEPNPDMSAIVFRETLQGHVLLEGNAYAEIEWNFSGQPFALWPLTPKRVKPERSSGGALRYRVINENGEEVLVDPKNMLHIPGLGYDGTCGYSVIAKARESFGLMAAAEKFGAQFFSQGARSGGVFKHPKTLSPTAKDYIKNSLKNVEPHEYIVLEEGMEIDRWTIPPDDAQFLETRSFEVAEVARWFGIPPHKLGDLSRATFSNIEQQEIDYVAKTLRRWLVRWEQEYTRKLVRPLERRIQLVEHNIDGLLRGDIATRYTAYAQGRQWGWLSVNDVREKENMNPIGAQGDVYLIPGNMLPADKADQIQPPGATPPAAPKPEPDPEADARALRAALDILRPEIERVETAWRQALEAGFTAEAEAMQAYRDSLQAEKAEREAGLEARYGEQVDRVLESAQASQDAAQRAAEALEAAKAQAAAPATAAEPLVVGPVEVAGMAELVERIKAETEATMAREQARDAALDARLTRTEDAVKESLARLTEGASRTAQRVQDRLATVAGAAAERQRYQQDRAGLVATCRLAITDGMRRLLHRESLAARKASGSPEKLRAWLDTFYARQQPMTDALTVALHLHGNLTRSVEPATARAEAVVATHCQRSKAELESLLASNPADLASAVEALTARWESDRPGQVAEELMGEVTANVSE